MSTRAIAGAATLLACLAQSAAALTAEDLWRDWQEVYGSFGPELTANEAYADGVLTLTDLTLSVEMAGVESRTIYGTITLVERPDGTVRIELPPVLPITSVTTMDGETVTQRLELTSEGLDMVASDAEGGRSYDIAAERITYSGDLVPADPSDPPVALVVTLREIESDVDTRDAEGATEIAQRIAASALSVALEAEGDGSFTFGYEAADVTGTTDMRLAVEGGPETSLLPPRLEATGRLAHAGAETALTAQTPDGPFDLRASSESGEVFVAIGEGGLTESFTSSGLAAAMNLPQFPVPISTSMTEFVAGFTIPVTASEEEADPIGLDLALRELVVDDALWSLLDPTGQLPRDPATLVVEIDGTAILREDPFADPAGRRDPTASPGELRSLTLAELLVSAAGATLRGSGDLAFPTPDPTQPVGRIDLALDGGFTLADRLAAIGLVSPDRIAVLKGMVGMVARPVGDDRLETEIEFTEDGGVAANGVRLR
jgi:hypothetical protein